MSVDPAEPTPSLTPDLDDFRRGFRDGYHNAERDKTAGIQYQRAYRAGEAAAKREREWHPKEAS